MRLLLLTVRVQTFAGFPQSLANDLLHAYDICTNPALHTKAHFMPPNVPNSRFTPTQLTTMTSKDLIEEVPPDEVTGFAIGGPVPEAPKERYRIILDTLGANVLMDDCRRVQLRTVSELRQLVTIPEARVGIAFDFSGWYQQLGVARMVGLTMAFRCHERWFIPKRGPMGHKYFVFVAHTITKTLALLATQGVSDFVLVDVIIDNVLFITSTTETAERIRASFLSICETYNVTLSDVGHPSHAVVHRGLHLDFRNRAVSLKASWVDRWKERYEELTHADAARWDKWRSLFGMLAWAVAVLQPCTDMWFIFKWAANCCAQNPKSSTHVKPWKSALGQLQLVAGIIARNEPVTPLGPRASPTTVIATDARLTGPFSSYGAIAVHVASGRILFLSGNFPLGRHTSINTAEAEAVKLGLFAINERLPLFGVSVDSYIDNNAGLFALTNCRSTNYFMYCVAMDIRSFTRARSINLRLLRVSSERNPSDGLSRGAPKPSEQDLQLLLELLNESCADGWDWGGSGVA
jgi:hypothetical protein